MTQLLTTDEIKQINVKHEQKVCVVDRTNNSSYGVQAKSEFTKLKIKVKITCQEISTKFFELGLYLKEIRDKQLWRYGGYPSFSRYAESHSITRQTAYNLIAVATNLSEQEALLYGPAISYVVASGSDKDAVAQLKQLANKGMTAKDLKVENKEINKIKNHIPKSPGRSNLKKQTEIIKKHTMKNNIVRGVKFYKKPGIIVEIKENLNKEICNDMDNCADQIISDLQIVQQKTCSKFCCNLTTVLDFDGNRYRINIDTNKNKLQILKIEVKDLNLKEYNRSNVI